MGHVGGGLFAAYRSVLSTDMSIPYWKPTVPQLGQCGGLLQLQPGHSWIVCKGGVTGAVGVASRSYLRGAWGLD